MAITQAMATSFKQQLLEGGHNFKLSGGNTFKLALYTSSATMDATTTVYASTNEVAASGTYSAGGGTLTRIDPTTSGTTAYTDFADLAFTGTTITARGALIYNSSLSNAAVVILDFGSDFVTDTGTFTVVFPAAAAATAIIRLA
jgi:hypothetical protein